MKKNLLDAETAPSFETRDACQTWIGKRVMRFKASFVNTRAGVYIDKSAGRVMDTTQPGYTKNEFDEPLAKIAKPVRDGAVWRAVIPVAN